MIYRVGRKGGMRKKKTLGDKRKVKMRGKYCTWLEREKEKERLK